MRTTALCCLALVGSTAFADEPVAQSAFAQTTAGVALMGISAAAALGATATGSVGLLGVRDHICGFTEESCNDSMNAAENRFLYAALGLSIVAAMTAAVGAPLYAKGHNAKKRMSFAVAPTFGAAGSGLTGSFALRF